MEDKKDKSVWLTRNEMREICPSCADEMVVHKLNKVKIMNADGEFVFAKAGFSQGLCEKFGGATGFRTRCMSAMAGNVDDEGAFCNSLKEYCHGSSGAEGKRAKEILQKDEKRRYTLGVVYEPDEVDTDEEFTDAAEIEKAAWDFMRELQGRRGLAKTGLDILSQVQKAVQNGDEIKLDVSEALEEIEKRGVSAMHVKDLDDCEVVESFIAPVDMKIGKETVKKGSWLAGIVWSEETFEKIESGEWIGYSMGGKARKEAA